MQGPHGPFFGRLAKALSSAGQLVTRVGFNAGDRAFWPRHLPYHPFTGTVADWPERLDALLSETGATDLVLYGDTRPIHATALQAARTKGLRLHVFEEGYLRPYWVTYERGGTNGHSALREIAADEMQARLGSGHPDRPMPPANWGAMQAHIFYGALYHFCAMTLNSRYRKLAPHRGVSLSHEARLYLKLLALRLPHWLGRIHATRRILAGGHPYHLVLLQLAHDANFREHGPFSDMGAFLAEVITGFAQGAPDHHHLVFKAHPLEDGRYPIRSEIRRLATQAGMANRVHFVGGGKLARLMDQASSAVTVNSTAAHQALWRGLPVKAFGEAVYTGRGFTSNQPLPQFFAAPEPPDPIAYRDFRRFLLATSQVPGSFYSIRGRRQVIRRIIDMIQADQSPYALPCRGKTAPKRALMIVDGTRP